MKLRIHGDNIIECERALKLIVSAYKATAFIKPCSIFMPLFGISIKDKEFFEVELLGGHDRWNVNTNVSHLISGFNSQSIEKIV